MPFSGGCWAIVEPPAVPFVRSRAIGAVVALPTVTIDEILSIVFFGTPAFERSATELYGRPAMIFLAVTGPMPGSASRSACEAVLRFTVPAGGAFVSVCLVVGF